MNPPAFRQLPAGPRSAPSALPWLAATLAERSWAALASNRADLVLFQREMVSLRSMLPSACAASPLCSMSMTRSG